MSPVYAEIELINSYDMAMARRQIITNEEVKSMHLNIRVDTHSHLLVINESIQAQMQFPILDKKKAQLADGRILECDEVGPIELKFKNRSTTCRAMVLPGDCEPLLGAIPLEGMDVLIDPLRQQLVVNPEHPDFAVVKMK